jgi:hypothetical protein
MKLYSKTIFLFLIILGLVVGSITTTFAHGGGTSQLVNADVGPYQLSVWTQPDPLQVGTAHLSVAVFEPPTSIASHTDTPVLEATVEITIEPLDHTSETVVTQATHQSAANKLLYEADVEIPTEGQWLVTVSVDAPIGNGKASFEISVLPAPSYNWWIYIGICLGIAVGSWVVYNYFYRVDNRLVR